MPVEAPIEEENSIQQPDQGIVDELQQDFPEELLPEDPNETSGVSPRIIDIINNQQAPEEAPAPDYSQSDLGRQTLEQQRQASFTPEGTAVKPLGPDKELFQFAPGQGVKPEQKEKQKNPYGEKYAQEKPRTGAEADVAKLRQLAQKDPKAAAQFLASHPDIRRVINPKEAAQIAGAAAKEAATDRLKDQVKKKAAAAVSRLMASLAANPVTWIVLAVVAAIIVIALVVGIAISQANRKTGDDASSQFGIASSDYGPSESNPDGILLRQMNPTKTLDFRGEKLGIEATSGRYIIEEPSTLDGNGTARWDNNNSQTLALTADGIKVIDPETGNKRSWTQPEVDYYVNMRYLYQSKINWDATGQSGPVLSGYGPKPSYAGRRLIVFNPVTKQAVVAVAAEYGPEPFVNACTPSGRNTEENNSNKAVTAYGDSYCEDESKKWNEMVAQGGNRPLGVPDQYFGAVMGIAPKVGQKLGIPNVGDNGQSGSDENLNLIIGWAQDQSLPPGPLVISSSDIIKGTLVGSGQNRLSFGNGGRIVIDPGHGVGSSNEGGEATLNGVRYSEAGIALQMSQYLSIALQARGHNVTLTRNSSSAPLVDGQTGTDIAARRRLATELNPDAFLSVHVDAASASNSGFFLIYREGMSSSKDSIELAKAVDTSLGAGGILKRQKDPCPDLSCTALGEQGKHLGALGAPVPSTLLELGDLYNKNDLSIITNTFKQIQIAAQIANGIDTFLRGNAPQIAVTKGVLPVPPIAQGESSDCADASLTMLLSYYATNHGTKPFVFGDLPNSLRGLLASKTGPSYVATTKVDGDHLLCSVNTTSRVANDLKKTNALAAREITDLARVDGISSTAEFDKVVQPALAAGHPVIVFTKEGGVYSNSKHVYVIVGYDAAKKAYAVHNPFPVGVHQATTNPNEHLQTSEHLTSHLKGEGHAAQLIINKKYCTNISGVSCQPGSI